MRWDIISAALTVASMIAVGQRKLQGWGLALLNSVAVCILAVSVIPKQWALVPTNVFCLAIYTRNLIVWQRDGRGRNMSRSAHHSARLRVWPTRAANALPAASHLKSPVIQPLP